MGVQISHPVYLGVQNVVADGLTRVMSLSSVEIPKLKRHLFVEDCIPRIFRLGGEGFMIAEQPGMIEGNDEEVSLWLQDFGEAGKRGIFVRYHNSIVGHLGAVRTLKALSLGGHGWARMRRNVTQMISECSICQKIKY